MLQEYLNKYFYNLFVITLLFGILLYDLVGFDYTDELCASALFILFGYYLFNTPDWSINRAFLITLGIFLFYLCYSFYIRSNVPAGILSDFIIQLKPYLAFFCVYSIAPVFSKTRKEILKSLSVLFWILLLIVAVAELSGIDAIYTVMGHPSYFGAAVIAVSLCYLYCTDFSLKNKLVFLLLLSVGLVAGRAKYYGFFALSTIIILYFSNLKHLKLNSRTIFVIACMLAAIVFVAWSKIELYFVQNITADGEDEDLIARFVLYATSLSVFKDYFPFGSGFGSFATYSSGLYYSDIYTKYGVEYVWGMSKSYYSFIADTYYPSLAQFGVAGVLLYISFWFYVVLKAFSYFKKDTNAQIKYFVIAILITGFLGIEGIADSTFSTHRGFFILMILGMTLSSMKTIALKNTLLTETANEQGQ
ncbi:Lipid A core - O-antigen ligase [Bacteroidales bacterium Barb4]|nr:Lipid A core - O-antigen ligase [Bacteroidales bacterium Barb4]